MDMFAQNLKDARKTGTKEPDKKRDGAADSKAQEMGDTGSNQAAVDQGKKSGPSEPIEDGTGLDGSKKAESGVELSLIHIWDILKILDNCVNNVG